MLALIRRGAAAAFCTTAAGEAGTGGLDELPWSPGEQATSSHPSAAATRRMSGKHPFTNWVTRNQKTSGAGSLRFPGGEFVRDPTNLALRQETRPQLRPVAPDPFCIARAGSPPSLVDQLEFRTQVG